MSNNMTPKERNRIACLKALAELVECGDSYPKTAERDVRRYIDQLELEIMQLVRDENLRKQKEQEHVSEDSI